MSRKCLTLGVITLNYSEQIDFVRILGQLHRTLAGYGKVLLWLVKRSYVVQLKTHKTLDVSHIYQDITMDLKSYLSGHNHGHKVIFSRIQTHILQTIKDAL